MKCTPKFIIYLSTKRIILLQKYENKNNNMVEETNQNLW